MRLERVALVLSGGGAKALAHAGAWLALEEAGLRPERVVGTSMGAVIGACFAAGMGYYDVVRAAFGIARRDVAALSPIAVVGGLFAPAVLRAEPLRATIARLVPARRWDELTIPLTVTAVELESGELTRFGAGGRTDLALVDALYASCALPVYYPPLVFQGRRYADGGLRATLPLEVVRPDGVDLVVAVDVGPAFDDQPAAEAARVPPLLRAHNAMTRILIAQQTRVAVERWGRKGASPRLVVVRPVAEREATFALGSIDRYVGEGYRATRRALA